MQRMMLSPACITHRSSTSTRPNGTHKSLDCYDHQVQADKQADGYTIPPTHVELEPDVEASLETEGEDHDLLEKWYKDSFHFGLTQAADVTKTRFGKYFNCPQMAGMQC